MHSTTAAGHDAHCHRRSIGPQSQCPRSHSCREAQWTTERLALKAVSAARHLRWLSPKRRYAAQTGKGAPCGRDAVALHRGNRPVQSLSRRSHPNPKRRCAAQTRKDALHERDAVELRRGNRAQQQSATEGHRRSTRARCPRRVLSPGNQDDVSVPRTHSASAPRGLAVSLTRTQSVPLPAARGLPPRTMRSARKVEFSTGMGRPCANL